MPDNEPQYTDPTMPEYQSTNPIDLLNTQQRHDLARILELQQKWPDVVTAQSPETMAGLLQQGLVPMVRGENGEVIACFYQQPLNSETEAEQQELVYRWGGLVTDSSREAKKAIIELIAEESGKFRQHHSGTAIAKTSNRCISRTLSESGWAAVDYDECATRFPEQLRLYLAHSHKPEEYYRDQMFYVLEPENIIASE